MTEDKKTKIDIPESIEAYKVTLFWGLTIIQVVIVFVASLVTGLGIMSVIARSYITALGMLLLASVSLLGLVEVRGRNFFRHMAFIFTYYKQKPRVLIYHHHASSGLATVQAKQLVFQKENNTKIFVMIFGSLVVGVFLLTFIIYFLFHVIHH
jgi:hypothetical protein